MDSQGCGRLRSLPAISVRHRSGHKHTEVVMQAFVLTVGQRLPLWADYVLSSGICQPFFPILKFMTQWWKILWLCVIIAGNFNKRKAGPPRLRGEFFPSTPIARRNRDRMGLISAAPAPRCGGQRDDLPSHYEVHCRTKRCVCRIQLQTAERRTRQRLPRQTCQSEGNG